MRTALLCALVGVLGAPEIRFPASVAQLAMPLAFNQDTVGSSPTRRTIVESSWWWVSATVTGYSPHDAIDAGHPSTLDTKTATMRDWRTHPYGIAADPRIIPYGTHIHVPGYLEKSEPYSAWQVDDTGGGMRKSWRRGIVHIDVRFKTEYSATRFGKRHISVLVDVSGMKQTQKSRLLPYKVGEL